ncbi:MAG: tyrosine/phenylalanine carboxypeptidase domain-containing protein [Nanobdellota archaeon]
MEYVKRYLKKTLDKYLSYYNPVNIKTEKKKFFKNLKQQKEYNPYFVYKPLNFDLVEAKKYVRLMRQYKGDFSEIFSDSALRYLNVFNLLKNRGKNFSAHSVLLFGLPTNLEIRKAREILKNFKGRVNIKRYNAAQTAEKLRKHAGKYGWEVTLGRSISKMRTAPSKRKLVISHDAMFSNEDIRRLRWHEIETHIKREFNDRKLPKKIRGLFDYIQTEEGLAVKMEELHGCNEQLPVYAVRLLAVDYAQNNSFYDVYMKLTKWLDPEAAFMTTVRVKRGLTDSSRPGGLTRDKIYLSGKIKIDNFLKKGKFDDLFLGKIGIKDVGLVKSILYS